MCSGGVPQGPVLGTTVLSGHSKGNTIKQANYISLYNKLSEPKDLDIKSAKKDERERERESNGQPILFIFSLYLILTQYLVFMYNFLFFVLLCCDCFHQKIYRYL